MTEQKQIDFDSLYSRDEEPLSWFMAQCWFEKLDRNAPLFEYVLSKVIEYSRKTVVHENSSTGQERHGTLTLCNALHSFDDTPAVMVLDKRGCILSLKWYHQGIMMRKNSQSPFEIIYHSFKPWPVTTRADTDRGQLITTYFSTKHAMKSEAWYSYTSGIAEGTKEKPAIKTYHLDGRLKSKKWPVVIEHSRVIYKVHEPKYDKSGKIVWMNKRTLPY